MKKSIFIMLAGFLLFVSLFSFSVSAFPPKHSKGLKSVNDVQLFSDGSILREGRSTLVRNDRGIRTTLHTSELESGTAVTLWWVVFNHPEECSHGSMGFRCGEGDLEVPEVDASVLYADGHVVGPRGRVSYNSRLGVGDTDEALFGPGLTHPLEADVHLIVHSHGKVIPGLTREMTHTFGAGCDNVPEGTGTPGPNTCVDLQFSVHESVIPFDSD